jgi:hypothetical protein
MGCYPATGIATGPSAVQFYLSSDTRSSRTSRCGLLIGQIEWGLPAMVHARRGLPALGQIGDDVEVIVGRDASQIRQRKAFVPSGAIPVKPLHQKRTRIFTAVHGCERAASKLLCLTGGPRVRIRLLQRRVFLPGVGHNFQDHYIARMSCDVRGIETLNERGRGLSFASELWRYVTTGTGMLTYSASLCAASVKVLEESATPDVQGRVHSSRRGRTMKKPGTTTRRNGTMRCAIYTRKSSEEGLEQEFNSLQAQREACEAFINSQRHEGWVCLRAACDDGGFSGASFFAATPNSALSDC